ncbi:hypothetical protein LTR08_000440 [Meristemomyces frigidus]|nr:hypothetical protein LTR08_000440 [Meristemomyces frigidus]
MTSDSTTPSEDRFTKEPGAAPAVQDPKPPSRSDAADGTQRPKDLRKGVKAVAFLGRLMGAKKKDVDEPMIEAETISNDGRPEGNDAAVFAQPVNNMGYNPRHLQPPAYIKMRAKNKKQQDFDRLFLAQELYCRKRRRVEGLVGSNKLRRKSSATPGSSTVWAMEFSKDGKHLAAAGVDTVVRVWAVLSSPEDRQKHEQQESQDGDAEANGVNGRAEHLNAPVFQSKPVREYEGHTATVLDLSWSKNNFLLSSSMDKTVRLWHTSRAECLCTFKHNDFVPSISFHPKDDRFFLAGSLDCRLRLWSIPDKSVAYSAQIPEMITAVAFTPDGKYCIAGCQNAKGSKITGIQAYHAPSGDVKVLITSNDSRIRLYNYRDKSLELKFKGNENNSSQIRATMSDDGRYVVCGSEDRKAYIWSLGPAEGEKRNKPPIEMFEAHDTITTAVCFAPANTRQLLSRSEDPLYDLCNPPPVTLRSRAERAGSLGSSRPPTENGSVLHTPVERDTRLDKPPPQPSPAFVTRSSHKEGNIIVTADFTGRIKVFRQDCAWSKRKPDDWDKASLRTKRSGKASSIATKASQRSLRNGASSLRNGGGSVSTQAPSDRILSWRQGIASNPALANGGRPSSSTKQTSRSVSPRKSVDQLGRTKSNGSVKSARLFSEEAAFSANQAGNGDRQATGKTAPPSPVSRDMGPKPEDETPPMIQDGESLPYWNTRLVKQDLERMRYLALHDNDGNTEKAPYPTNRMLSDADGLLVRPDLASGPSFVSRLSDERSSNCSDDDHDVFDDAKEHGESEMRCRHCGSDSFSARRVGVRETRLVCTGCGIHA